MKKSGGSFSDGESSDGESQSNQKKKKDKPEGHGRRRSSLVSTDKKEMSVKNVKINVGVIQSNASQETSSQRKQHPSSTLDDIIEQPNDEEVPVQTSPDEAAKAEADDASPNNVNAGVLHEADHFSMPRRSSSQEPKDLSRVASRSHMEGDVYKSKRASDFMPALPIPGVKYPAGTTPREPSLDDVPVRRRSRSRSRTISDTEVGKVSKAPSKTEPPITAEMPETQPSRPATTVAPIRRLPGRRVVQSSSRPGEPQSITREKFHAKMYGPQDTNKDNIKIQIAVAGPGQRAADSGPQGRTLAKAEGDTTSHPLGESRDVAEIDQQQPDKETKEKQAEKVMTTSPETASSIERAKQRDDESKIPVQTATPQSNQRASEEQSQVPGTSPRLPSSGRKSSGDGHPRRVTIESPRQPTVIEEERSNFQTATRGPQPIGKDGVKAQIVVVQPKRRSDDKEPEVQDTTMNDAPESKPSPHQIPKDGDSAQTPLSSEPAQQPVAENEAVVPQSPANISNQASHSQIPAQPTKIEYIAPFMPKAERARHPRRVVITPERLPTTEQKGPDYQTTTYGPFATNKRGIKGEITIAKPKEPEAIPLPLPPPPPIPVPQLPEKPKEPIVEKPKKRSHDIPSPELVEDTNIDAMNVLKKFSIPDQSKALESLLDKETVHFDFGGLMRQYYSYVLRSYCLINMQDRYRGASKLSDCFTSIDIAKVGTREEEMEKNTKAKLRRLDDKREKLRRVSVDDDHFNYLKNLANNQICLLPLTIVQMMNEQMAPVLEDIFRFYGKNLGTEHKCTKVAGFHYVKIRKRVAMYNHICGGSTINEDLSSFYK